jgi:hypothetical protein
MIELIVSDSMLSTRLPLAGHFGAHKRSDQLKKYLVICKIEYHIRE